MSSLDQDLAAELDSLTAQGLRRRLRRVQGPQGARVTVDGRELLNFSSNDYLGLAGHPELREAAARVARDSGAGAGASRLICGSLEAHHILEETLAEWKGTQAAIVFATGYSAALGAIPALVGKDDVVVVDKLVHACAVDAARLSGAKMRVFSHNDPQELEDILKWAAARPSTSPTTPRSRPPRTLVIVESVYSMDGDIAPLRAIAMLKEKYGAWLMIDEAHAGGLYGAQRRGVAEALGCADAVDIHLGTLGKAIGASGGFIAGSKVLVDFLVNRARSFIFSTAPVPAASAAATRGVQVVRGPEGAARCARLWENVRLLRSLLGLPSTVPPFPDVLAENAPCASPIVPVILGDEDRALAAAAALFGSGFYVPAIRYPTVARGSARLRVTLSADHTADQILALHEVLKGASSAAA